MQAQGGGKIKIGMASLKTSLTVSEGKKEYAHTKWMWFGEYEEWAQTAQGGLLSKANANANWMEWLDDKDIEKREDKTKKPPELIEVAIGLYGERYKDMRRDTTLEATLGGTKRPSAVDLERMGNQLLQGSVSGQRFAEDLEEVSGAMGLTDHAMSPKAVGIGMEGLKDAMTAPPKRLRSDAEGSQSGQSSNNDGQLEAKRTKSEEVSQAVKLQIVRTMRKNVQTLKAAADAALQIAAKVETEYVQMNDGRLKVELSMVALLNKFLAAVCSSSPDARAHLATLISERSGKPLDGQSTSDLPSAQRKAMADCDPCENCDQLMCLSELER